MEKTKSNPQTDKLVTDLVDNQLMRFSVQLFYKTSEGLRPYGSGVLAFIHDTHFIFTASHVCEYLEKEENHLYIQIGKSKFINVIGEIKSSVIDESRGVDLAYIKIDSGVVKSLHGHYNYVTTDKISHHKERLDAANYSVIGFPENNIKFKDKIMETGSSFYLTSASNDKPYKHYKLNEEDFFIVNMEGKGTDLETGEKTKINSHFHGISGGGLWYIKFKLDQSTC